MSIVKQRPPSADRRGEWDQCTRRHPDLGKRRGYRAGMTDQVPVEDWTTDYDLSDPAYVENPVPIWKEMREKCPIAHSERFGGSWNPTKFDDIRELAKMVPDLSSRQPLVMPPPPGTANHK